MKAAPTARKLLHTAFAVLFGVMSLAHGPVMAATHEAPAPAAAPAQPAALMDHGGHHHEMSHAAHHAMAATDDTGSPASGPATCYSFACFLAVASPPIVAPAVSLILLGQLAAHPPYVGSPVVIEPADPPPRLQA
jgi:uncharacterized protein involved in copper resistance